MNKKMTKKELKTLQELRRQLYGLATVAVELASEISDEISRGIDGIPPATAKKPRRKRARRRA